MVKYDFSAIAATPKARINPDSLMESQMVGLEAFLGKPIDADGVAPATETPCYSTCSGEPKSSSNCSNYCSTSTCAQCC